MYPTTGPTGQPRPPPCSTGCATAFPQAETASTLVDPRRRPHRHRDDYAHVLGSKLPLFVAVVVSLAFLLLAAVFRSLLIPLVASVLNLLSFGVRARASSPPLFPGAGASSLLGFGRHGPMDAFLDPVVMFAVLFGLSTDYEVYTVSRMHEEWTLSGDNKRAVIRGQAETGRVITAASLIMILVFVAFILTGQEAIMQIGLGFAAAIFVDAYIIRTVLVPALMHMLGRANWWLPGWLDRLLPRLHVEPAELTPSGLLREPTSVGPRER